jgi:undecaprenyl-diphosphatase
MAQVPGACHWRWLFHETGNAMTLFHLVVLAIVQGITEFLPISSSAHLILVPQALGTQDQGLVLDVAVHVGTLFAVIVYFRREVADMLHGLASLVVPSMVEPGETARRNLAGAVLVAAVPVMVAGVLFRVVELDQMLRSIIVIGWASIGFGVLLWWADKYCAQTDKLESLNPPKALVIGLAQILALIPGTSRSGITITAARYLGFDRVEAARFSMLLALPVIGAAGLLGVYEIAAAGDMVLGADALIGMILSYMAAYATIALFMRFAQNHSMTVFVIYRCVLGIGLLLVGYDLLG